MNKTIELLAPGGDLLSIKAAIAAGADAVYCGLNNFNARNRAENIDFDDLVELINLAHRHDCQIFLTLNIIILESEFRGLVNLLNRLVNTALDGVIVQDLGLFYLLDTYFKGLKIHASTQMTTHNPGQVEFLSALNATRCNLSRELNLAEIEDLTATAHRHKLLTEVFVHGSNCLSFSGLCYLSSVLEGKSGNRGRCSQPCREQYVTTSAGNNFPLNLKDNSAFADLEQLAAAGVDSLKIEGRVKKFHYVYTVVNSWRKRLNNFYTAKPVRPDDSDLYRVFNRDFSNGFLQGNINKSMYIDNPRDNSAQHYARQRDCTSAAEIDTIKGEIYTERSEIIAQVSQAIADLDHQRTRFTIEATAGSGERLSLKIEGGDQQFTLTSKSALCTAEAAQLAHNNKKNIPRPLTNENLSPLVAALERSGVQLGALNLDNLPPQLLLPTHEIELLAKRLTATLSGRHKAIAPFKLPPLPPTDGASAPPRLAIFIAQPEDVTLGLENGAEFFFQLPESLSDRSPELVKLFKENPTLIPYFPALLIGADYQAALEILRQVQPRTLLTDNFGIAFEAFRQKIPWLAGPYLNIANSYSLLCLKEKFNCRGAFLSNELSRAQINKIVAPPDFELGYSLYHPIVLMTSRQCLLQQVEDCPKQSFDDECLRQCARSSSLSNLKERSIIIDKSAGRYHRLLNPENFLNTAICEDLPGRFTRFAIDLSTSRTTTTQHTSKPAIIEAFTQLLQDKDGAQDQLHRMLTPTTNAPYRKGI